jgi:hypothetical protein
VPVHPGRWVIPRAPIASAGRPGSSVATLCNSVMVCLFMYVDPERIDRQWVAVGAFGRMQHQRSGRRLLRKTAPEARQRRHRRFAVEVHPRWYRSSTPILRRSPVTNNAAITAPRW